MTVDAIRIPIMNFFVEKQSDSWHITGSSQDTTKVESPVASTFDFTNSYANRMPSELHVDKILMDSETSFFGVFGNDRGQEIRLSISPAESSVCIDSENAYRAEKVSIHNYQGVLIAEDESCRVVWLQDNVLITIICKNMDTQSVISLADDIAKAK